MAETTPATTTIDEADEADEATADAADETAAPVAPISRSAAFGVVLFVGGLALVLLLGLAFSTTNTRQSIDGTSATTSQWVPPAED